jgi:hypothetical protein
MVFEEGIQLELLEVRAKFIGPKWKIEDRRSIIIMMGKGWLKPKALTQISWKL